MLLKEKMKVVMVEPGQYARITEMEHRITTEQTVVDGGSISCLYPWDKNVCIVAPNETIPEKMLFNRYIKDVRLFGGPFYICGYTEDGCCSLTDEQAERYRQMFLRPELFIMQEYSFIHIQYDNPHLPGAPEEVAERIKQRGGLPEFCFAAQNGGDGLVMFEYGEKGYHPIQGPFGFMTGQEYADILNERLGVSKAQRSAMLFGSLYGWDTPYADPARYGTDGRLILPKRPQKGKEER